jgi:hypothetical protein
VGEAGSLGSFDDIIHAVTSIPDSFSNWFYGDKRSEEGKALVCSVRCGDLSSPSAGFDDAEGWQYGESCE